MRLTVKLLELATLAPPVIRSYLLTFDGNFIKAAKSQKARMEVQATQPSLKHIYTEENGYPVPEKRERKGSRNPCTDRRVREGLTSIHSIQIGWRI